MKQLICIGLLLICSVYIQAQTVTPTQNDVITNDNGNNQADPGETIRYKVDLTNSGGDANGVQLNAVPDANTTLVPGSFRSSPLALPDSYACTGNVGITVPAGSGVLVNDFDDDIAGLTITAAAGATTEGGAFAIAADGGFSYQPPAGFTGTDEFTYTLEDGNELPDCPPTDEGTVTITVSNLIWFVDNTGGGSGGDGRLNTPFKTLSDFNANSTPVGDVTYIEHTGTDYTGGIVLQNNERLFGEGHSGGTNLAEVVGFTLPPFSNLLPTINGTPPLITNTSSGDGIRLASGNTVRGLNVGNCADFGIDDNGDVGSLSVNEVNITNNTGGGFRTDNGGNLNVTLSSLTSSGGTNGINLNNCSGTFSVSGTTSVNNSTVTGVSISSNNATVAFNVLNITNTTTNQTGLFASGGTVNSTSGAINTGSGRAVDMDNAALGMVLTSVSSNGGSVPGIDLNTTTGSFTVAGTGTTQGSGGTIENKMSDGIVFNSATNITLKNMIVEDIGGTGSAQTEQDGIHGANVTNMVLDNLVIRRISDMAIHGADFPNGTSGTNFNGLEIRNCTIEDSNRFHVAGAGDSSDESLVRIVGITGTVTITNSTFQRGAELIDFFTTSSGTLNMTVTSSDFNYAYKEFTSGPVSSVGRLGLDVTVQGSAVANVTIGDESNAALGNSFLNCRVGSVRLGNDAGATGNMTFLVSNNNFTVDDHSSGIGGDFDFPMGGLKLSSRGTNTPAINAIVSNNYFDEVTNADGGVGQFTLDMDGGQWQASVENNTFDTPGNAPFFVRADNSGNAGSMNSSVIFQNNTYIRGAFCSPDPAAQGGGCNLGMGDLCSGVGGYCGPGIRSLVQTQSGGNIDITFSNENFARHDVGFDPGNTVEIQALSGGGTACVNFVNNSSPHGYAVEHSGGTLNVQKGASNTGPCSGCTQAQIQDVFDDNGNTGGGGNPATDPPEVTVFGTVNVISGQCAQPSGGIFAFSSPLIDNTNIIQDAAVVLPSDEEGRHLSILPNRLITKLK